MLRILLAVFGVALIAIGIFGVPVLPFALPPGTPFFLGGLCILLAIVFEARRYRGAAPSSGSEGADAWQKTDERFVDPSTGKRMSVRYNPQTGERDYVEEKPLP